ncbi:MAG: hypothetical protein DRP62_08030, partial [Planctomycetota bacterium]
ASELFNDALQKDNTLIGPRYRLAQCAFAEGHKSQGRDYLISEAELAPEDTDALVSMGSMFLAIGDTDWAANCLLRAVDIDCANADAYYYLGLVSVVKGEAEDALEFFGHVLDSRPDHIPALRDSAIVYLAMGRLAGAAERIKKAMALDADDSQLKALERKIKLAQVIERITDFLAKYVPAHRWRG